VLPRAAKIALAAAAVYLLSPIDLIPDFVPSSAISTTRCWRPWCSTVCSTGGSRGRAALLAGHARSRSTSSRACASAGHRVPRRSKARIFAAR